MDNEFSVVVYRLTFFLNYVDWIFSSLEEECILINDRIRDLDSKVSNCQIKASSLDYKKEAKRIEQLSVRECMREDDRGCLTPSSAVATAEQRLGLLVKKNLPRLLARLLEALSWPDHPAIREKAVEPDPVMDSLTGWRQHQLELSQVQRRIVDDHLLRQAKKGQHQSMQQHHGHKSWRMSNFRHSISKFFRLKSQSAKCLASSTKEDDVLYQHRHQQQADDSIPQTIYLSPRQQQQLCPAIGPNRTTDHTPNQSSSGRHSCSDLICRRSSTFCVHDSPSARMASPETGDRSRPLGVSSAFVCYEQRPRSPSCQQQQQVSMSHSLSLPSGPISRSHSTIDRILTASPALAPQSQPQSHHHKRMSRRRGLFNCSLFRKRTKSHEKPSVTSTETVAREAQDYSSKTKSLTRYSTACPASPKTIAAPAKLVDRSVTLPNLRASDLDIHQSCSRQTDNQLFSFDLVKDYINRSEHSLCSKGPPAPTTCLSMTSSLSSSAAVKTATATTAPLSHCLHLPASCALAATPTASSNTSSSSRTELLNSSEVSQSLIRCSGSICNASRRDILCRQTSAPHTPPRTQQPQQPYRGDPTQNPQQLKPRSTPAGSNSDPLEFWTRPQQEKIKASRRRLHDDHEAVLRRSLSPASAALEDVYRTPSSVLATSSTAHVLQAIPEPPSNEHQMTFSAHDGVHSMNRSLSLYSSMTAVSTRPCRGPVSSTSSSSEDASSHHRLNHNLTNSSGSHHSTHSPPQLEYRLLSESPLVPTKTRTCLQQPLHKLNPPCYKPSRLLYANYLNFETLEHSSAYTTSNGNEMMGENAQIIALKHAESTTVLPDQGHRSTAAAMEMPPTRTPTPPASFAECASSVSSTTLPAPSEFGRAGNVNLLYTSNDEDDGDDDDEGVCDYEAVPVRPAPPPRLDSVVRSQQLLHQQTSRIDPDHLSELEYDMDDDNDAPCSPPVFGQPPPCSAGVGAIVARGGQYREWRERLPYKLPAEGDSSVEAGAPQRKSSGMMAAGGRLDLEDGSILDAECLRRLRHLQTRASSSHLHRRSWAAALDQSACADVPIRHQQQQLPPGQTMSPMTESTLLRQYSHLYSLKMTASPHNCHTPLLYAASSLESIAQKLAGTSTPLQASLDKRKSAPLHDDREQEKRSKDDHLYKLYPVL